MNFNRLVFTLHIFSFLLVSCSKTIEHENKNQNYLDETFKLAKLNTTQKTFIHVINIGDCLTCVATGKNWFRILEKTHNLNQNIVLVTEEMSDLKFNALLTERIPIENQRFIDSLHIIRNTTLFNNLQNKFNTDPKFSFLLIVENDSIVLFNKKFKDPSFLKEVGNFLN